MSERGRARFARVLLFLVSGWLQWAFVVGAVVLPYLAVIAANAGRENDRFANEPVAPASATELPAAATRIIPGGPAERP